MFLSLKEMERPFLSPDYNLNESHIALIFLLLMTSQKEYTYFVGEFMTGDSFFWDPKNVF